MNITMGLSKYAQIVLGLVSVSDTGMVRWGPLDRYAKAFGTDYNQADAILDDVTDELERKEIWEDYHGTAYDVEAIMERDRWEAEQDAEHEQYLADIDAAWQRAKGFA